MAREHGKHSTYANGCRCDECRRAHAVYRAESRSSDPERAREQLSRWKEKNPDRVRELRRMYYRNNREYYGDKVRRAMARNLSLVDDVRSSCACESCGSTDNIHFHHRDPRAKKFNLSNPGSWSLESVRRELEKCGALCCRCHAATHHRMREMAS